MNWKNSLISALLSAGCAAALLSPSARAGILKPVTVTGGQVQGVPSQDAAITVFRGLPFAAPPVGDLRWRAPQPVQPWQGVLKAAKFGNSCIQKVVYERKPWTHEFMSHNDISEDCLYLNVWTPAASSAEKLPVYVYIHGGGNVEGSGAVPVYDGVGLARKGIVVVTINYRLGVFGYFAHPELTAETPYHASGNYAELDVIAALQWVRQNIASFGGDPAKVTIGGQSAGSGHVFTMTLTPLAKGLFRGAINESGTGLALTPAMASTLLTEAEKKGVEFATAKGAKSIAELRRLSWQEILDPIAPPSPGSPAPTFRFGGVIDGYLFPATPQEIYAQGKQNDVPTITGINRNDSGGIAPDPNATLATFREAAQKRFGAVSDEFFKLYPAASDAEAKAAQRDSGWDSARTGYTVWAAKRAKTAKTSFYTYFWDHTLPGPDAALYEAFHTSEVPYVMNALAMSDRPFTEADHKIADAMSSYWANFIKSGDPNGAELAHWPSAAEQPGTMMKVGDKFAPIPVAGDKAKQSFFERFYSNPRP